MWDLLVPVWRGRGHISPGFDSGLNSFLRVRNDGCDWGDPFIGACLLEDGSENRCCFVGGGVAGSGVRDDEDGRLELWVRHGGGTQGLDRICDKISMKCEAAVQEYVMRVSWISSSIR